MAQTENLPIETMESIAQSINDFVPAAPPSPADDKAGAEDYLGESFSLWTVLLDELPRVDEHGKPIPIEKLATWNGVWHHQIRGIGKGTAKAYARTLETTRGSQHETLGIFYSKLASDIDEGIDWIDRKHPELGDQWAARLLVIPEIQFITIWLLLEGEVGRFVPLYRLPDTDENKFRCIDEKTFREECLNAPRIDGFERRPLKTG
jgi:hypothetical protein